MGTFYVGYMGGPRSRLGLTSNTVDTTVATMYFWLSAYDINGRIVRVEMLEAGDAFDIYEADQFNTWNKYTLTGSPELVANEWYRVPVVFTETGPLPFTPSNSHPVEVQTPIKGEQGPQGLPGPVGPQGLPGSQGVTGNQGPKGDVGVTGAVGSQGPQGLQGVKGDQGIQGIKGDTGSTGPLGPVGPTGVIPVVELTQAAYDALAVKDPTVMYTITDGADRTVLAGTAAPNTATGIDGDFFINSSAWTVQGPKAASAWPAPVSMIGPQGPAGVQGPVGPQGLQGVWVQMTQAAYNALGTKDPNTLYVIVG